MKLGFLKRANITSLLMKVSYYLQIPFVIVHVLEFNFCGAIHISAAAFCYSLV